MISWLGRLVTRSDSPHTGDVVFAKNSSIDRSNNSWLCCPSHADIAIIFVHGLNSDASKCWKSVNGAYWPSLIVEDPLFHRCAVFLGGFHTNLNSGRYDIAQCSEELQRALEFCGFGERSPLSFSNVIFVCHSLGGIVARRLLESNSSAFTSKNVGLVLIASPSLGSTYGTRFKNLASLFKHKVILSLRKDSAEIVDIDNRFRSMLARGTIPALVGAEAVEHRSVLSPKFFPELWKPIVEPMSASRYFGPTQIIANTDHSTIVKPNSLKHESHQFLSHFYQTKYLGIATVENEQEQEQDNVILTERLITQINIEPLAHSAVVLFDVYQNVNSDYYLPRSVDQIFERKIATSALWIIGPSGSGKTSLARRFIKNKGKKPVEVTLSYCEDKLTQEYCLAEILDSASSARFDGAINTRRTFKELVENLCLRGQSTDVLLFLDEVPVSPSDAKQILPFLRFIADLLDAVKKQVGSHARFVICSIERPVIDKAFAKLLEQISFISLIPWTTQELNDLYRLIAENLPLISLDQEILSDLIHESRGSPRFIKKFVRELLVEQDYELATQKQVLAKTVEHFNEFC